MGCGTPIPHEGFLFLMVAPTEDIGIGGPLSSVLYSGCLNMCYSGV